MAVGGRRLRARHLLLAVALGYLCIMVTCASGPLGGPATVTAARPVRVHHDHGTQITSDDAGAVPSGFPALPRLALQLATLVGLLLAVAATATRLVAIDAPEPHRRWRAPDPPRRGPPLLLVP